MTLDIDRCPCALNIRGRCPDCDGYGRKPEYVTIAGRIAGNEVDGYMVELLENGAVIRTVRAHNGAYDTPEFRKLKHARRALDAALRAEADRRVTAIVETDEMTVRVR